MSRLACLGTLVFLLGCGAGSSATVEQTGTGGTILDAGIPGSGGAVGSGGVIAGSGGAVGSGGVAGSGGASGSDGEACPPSFPIVAVECVKSYTQDGLVIWKQTRLDGKPCGICTLDHTTTRVYSCYTTAPDLIVPSGPAVTVWCGY